LFIHLSLTVTLGLTSANTEVTVKNKSKNIQFGLTSQIKVQASETSIFVQQKTF
jgi:hypothetical protein